MRASSWLLFCALILISGWAVVGPAWAAGLSVSPVLVKLGAGQRSGAITLSNGGDQPQRVQVEAFRWTRVNGEDALTPETKLLLNPPLFEMAPGGSQIVRLGFRGGTVPPPGELETAYRVFFQEVPRAQLEGGTALHMVLRIGVPMFVEPAQPRRDTQWSAALVDGELQLQLENRGNVHTRVANLRVSQPPSGAEQRVDGFVYVFPGETQRWTLPAAGAQGTLLIDALMDNGGVHVELPLKNPG